MESSPLTRAHDHARAAAVATQTADTTVAIAEHAQAAGEFANASKTTSSIEALRTLRLLEQHHRRLAELLKLPLSRPAKPASDADVAAQDEDEKVEQAEQETEPPKDASPPKDSLKHMAPKPLPTLSHQRYPGRNLTSSIANNLASARGIRARYTPQPLTPSITNDQAPGSLEVHPRKQTAASKPKLSDPDQRRPSWVPPAIKEDTVAESSKPEDTNPPPTSEDGFTRFYNTFGSLIHKLSAPLAFAGLPLLSEEPAPSTITTSPAPSETPSPSKKHRQKPSPSTPNNLTEPDLSKIYSRATLRSLDRDGHNPNESFYVVPPSGHTASYASILNHEHKEKRRLAALRGGTPSTAGSTNPFFEEEDEEDEDDFVDARESQPPRSVSPASHRKRGYSAANKSRSEKELRNIIEELHLENASLKDVLDKVSKRLHAFELNSQSSHLALAQSLRLHRPGSPTSLTSPGAGGGGGAGGEEVASLRKRNRELEEQLAEMAKRMESLEKDNLKLQLNLEKYRERWEKLKAGAKARREAQRNGEAAVAAGGGA